MFLILNHVYLYPIISIFTDPPFFFIKKQHFMKLAFYQEAQKIWQNIALDVDIGNLAFELQIHKKLLNIFQVGDFYYFIFNVKNAEFEFVSPEIQKILGYDPETLSTDFFLSQIHPEDQIYFLNFENKLHHFFKALPSDKIEKYKVRYDFRIKNSEDRYIRILHQLIIIQHEGIHIFRSLGVHTDITYLKPEGKPVLSFIGLEGEPSYIDVTFENIYQPTKEVLSRREKEILKYLAEGKNSAQIAKILSLSKFTVDTHRKNILKKTKSFSTSSLISKSINEGWI